VGSLEAQKHLLEQQDPQGNAEQIAGLEAQIAHAQEKLELPEAGGPGSSRPLPATLVPTDRPAPIPLKLYLKPGEGGAWQIVDMTQPDPSRVRVYRGEPDPKLQGQGAVQSAIEAAWQDFVSNNQLPAGQVVASPPPELGFAPGTEWSDASSGISDLEALSQTAATLGLIPSLALVGTALSPVPGDEAVVTMLLLGTGAAGVISSGASLLDQLEHENLRLDSIQTQLNLLGLAGSLAVGTAGALRVTGKALSVTQMKSAVLITEGVEGFSDGASGLLMSWVYWQQIQQIQQRHDLSEEEKQKQIEGVLQQAAQLGGIVLLGTVTTRQRSFEVEVKQRVDTGDLDQSMADQLLEYNQRNPRGRRKVDEVIEEFRQGRKLTEGGDFYDPAKSGSRAQRAEALVESWDPGVRQAYEQVQQQFASDPNVEKVVPLQGVATTQKTMGDILTRDNVRELIRIVRETYEQAGDPDAVRKAGEAMRALKQHEIVVVKGTDQLRAYDYSGNYTKQTGQDPSGELHHWIPLYLGGDHRTLLDMPGDLHKRLHQVINNISFDPDSDPQVLLSPNSIQNAKDLTFHSGAAILNNDSTIDYVRLNPDGTHTELN